MCRSPYTPLALLEYICWQPGGEGTIKESVDLSLFVAQRSAVLAVIFELLNILPHTMAVTRVTGLFSESERLLAYVQMLFAYFIAIAEQLLLSAAGVVHDKITAATVSTRALAGAQAVELHMVVFILDILMLDSKALREQLIANFTEEMQYLNYEALYRLIKQAF